MVEAGRICGVLIGTTGRRTLPGRGEVSGVPAGRGSVLSSVPGVGNAGLFSDVPSGQPSNAAFYAALKRRSSTCGKTIQMETSSWRSTDSRGGYPYMGISDSQLLADFLIPILGIGALFSLNSLAFRFSFLSNRNIRRHLRDLRGCRFSILTTGLELGK